MKKSSFFGLLLSLHFLEIVYGQIPLAGDCPDRTPLKSIDPRKLSGLWYENQRTSSLVEWPFKCIVFKVTPFFERKSTVKVTSVNRLNGRLEKHTVPLLTLDPEGRNGKMEANISETITNGVYAGEMLPLQLLAMDKDAKKWGVIWSCRPFKKARLHTENIWVLTRDRDILEEEETVQEIQRALVSLNLEHLLMRDSVQTECAEEDDKDDQ